MAPVRLTSWLTAAVLLTALSGCGGWRIGEPSLNRSLAQAQVTGPAPALLIVAAPRGEGWVTVTPLADGTLLTAAHVLRGLSPLRIDGQDIRSLDAVRSGGGGKLGTADIFVGDWVHFRAEPFEHTGWPVSARRPNVGETVTIRGFTDPVDVTGRPLLREVRARLREPPSWIDTSQRRLIYAEIVDGASTIDLAGMSGGPVLLKDATTGAETLVGIFSGTMTAKWLIFRKRVWVIQPWPQ